MKSSTYDFRWKLNISPHDLQIFTQGLDNHRDCLRTWLESVQHLTDTHMSNSVSENPQNPNTLDRVTDSMDPKREKMEILINTTNFMTESDDSSDTYADESLGYAHNPDEMVIPQTEVRISQTMTTSYDTPMIPYQG